MDAQQPWVNATAIRDNPNFKREPGSGRCKGVDEMAKAALVFAGKPNPTPPNPKAAKCGGNGGA